MGFGDIMAKKGKKGKSGKKLSAKAKANQQRAVERAAAKARQAELEANPTLGMRLSKWYKGNTLTAWMAAGVIALATGTAYLMNKDPVQPPAVPVFTPEIPAKNVDFDVLPSGINNAQLEDLLASYANRPYDSLPFERSQTTLNQTKARMDKYERETGHKLPPLIVLLQGAVDGASYQLYADPSAHRGLEGLKDKKPFFLFVKGAIDNAVGKNRGVFKGPAKKYVFLMKYHPSYGGTLSTALAANNVIEMNAKKWVEWYLRNNDTDHDFLHASLEHEVYHVNEFVVSAFHSGDTTTTATYRPKFWREFTAIFAEVDGFGYANGLNQKQVQKHTDWSFSRMMDEGRKLSRDMSTSTDNDDHDYQGTRVLASYAAGVVFKSLGTQERFGVYVAALLHEDIRSPEEFDKLNERFDIRTSTGTLTYDQVFQASQALLSQ